MIKIARLAVLPLLFGTVLTAGSVTYTYVGPDFNGFLGADNSGVETNISVSFTLASPLQGDLDNFVTPLSFQISDGSATLTDQSPNTANVNTGFFFRTLDTGQIYIWEVSVFQTNGSGWLSLSTETDVDQSVSCANGDLYDCFSGDSYADVFYSQPPTQPAWTESAAAPEPSSIALEALGSLILLIGHGLKSRPARVR